jgi:hypothetical protein
MCTMSVYKQQPLPQVVNQVLNSEGITVGLPAWKVLQFGC